jgi:hypothetical protein
MSPPAFASAAGPGSILPLGGEHPGPNADRLQQDLCLLEGEVALIVVRRDPLGVAEPEAAAAPLGAWLCPGDLVLLKASRAVALERLLPLLGCSGGTR